MTLLAVLLALIPALPASVRPCVTARAAAIEAQAHEGERVHGVPAELLLAVGLVETHWGCDRGESGGWGAPISPRRRHVAGTHLHAARALARSHVVCGSWQRAVDRFHHGLCVPRRQRGYSSAYVVGLADRVRARAAGRP